MTRYMLDTNIVSHLLRGHPAVLARVTAAPMVDLCLSAITGAELMYGLAKRPTAARLARAVDELLRRIEVLPWAPSVMAGYGEIRATLESQGQPMGALDLLIAAHALDSGAVLVTNDQAFHRVPGLVVEDWTKSSGN
ncbi:tRNA(fMet)-specific endonuclease VapC [Cupriavidus gilardii J11]|uniref:Ribonuclease VapC n=1 Tax=Cupriavidus gilardii J11 TaxID=936133 RepID=A0A562B2Y1_9BURK|nr:tRNA(fMet)-specific endonuclease VapC [Cupriavidus gilardii J11]